MEIHIWQRRLARSDVVLRGCRREPPQRLLQSMLDHEASLYVQDGEYGLSVGCEPGRSESEILLAATHLKQTHYRVGEVAYFLDLGLVVVWDHARHGLILSLEEPTFALAEKIAAGFSEPKPNPYHEERSRRSASR